jgi:hypothetical protein
VTARTERLSASAKRWLNVGDLRLALDSENLFLALIIQ